MNSPCDKCKAVTALVYHYSFGNTYGLCSLCNWIIEHSGITGVLEDFMKDNASSNENIPMSHAERSMLQAREKRAKGETCGWGVRLLPFGYYSNWHEKVVY